MVPDQDLEMFLTSLLLLYAHFGTRSSYTLRKREVDHSSSLSIQVGASCCQAGSTMMVMATADVFCHDQSFVVEARDLDCGYNDLYQFLNSNHVSAVHAHPWQELSHDKTATNKTLSSNNSLSFFLFHLLTFLALCIEHSTNLVSFDCTLVQDPIPIERGSRIHLY